MGAVGSAQIIDPTLAPTPNMNLSKGLNNADTEEHWNSPHTKVNKLKHGALYSTFK